VTAIAVQTPATSLTPTSMRAQPAPPAYVHPGQLAVSAGPSGPAQLVTILGSCVAVCLHDPVTRIGGLNHYLLPFPTEDFEPSARYAPMAIEQLVHCMLSRGAKKPTIWAQIIGGASVLAAFASDSNHLGRRNVTAAQEILASMGIPVKGTDTGGTHGRKLVFSPKDGTAVVHLLGR
jgi:chemotaxis protein CheD